MLGVRLNMEMILGSDDLKFLDVLEVVFPQKEKTIQFLLMLNLFVEQK